MLSRSEKTSVFWFRLNLLRGASVRLFSSHRFREFRDAAVVFRLALARGSRGGLLRRQARMTDTIHSALAFPLHTAAYAVQSAATSSSALVTVGGFRCAGAEMAEFAYCTYWGYSSAPE